MSRLLPILVNVALFNALWAVTIAGAGESWWWAGPALIAVSAAAQLLLFSPSVRRDAMLILCGAAGGVLLDWIAVSAGAYRFLGGSTGTFVIVFAALWINFGTTLRPSLSWIWPRPALAAVLGAIGGVTTYWIASRMGAIEWGEPSMRGMLWVGAQYAIALPALTITARRLDRGRGGIDHQPPRPAATPGAGT